MKQFFTRFFPYGRNALVISLACFVAAPPAAADDASEAAFREANAGKIVTVLGVIDADEAGATLPHEHFFLDLSIPLNAKDRWAASGRNHPDTEEELYFYNLKLRTGNRAEVRAHLWDTADPLVLDDEKAAIAEAKAIKAAGGATVVDVTSQGLGRDPARLVRVARASGLNVVMGAGWYRAAWRPMDFGARSVDDIADEIVADIIEGAGKTRVRAGVIGEIPAMDVSTGPDTDDAKQIRAAARASRRTGAAITLHQWVGDGKTLAATLDILETEGADLSRVIVGHVGGDAMGQMPILEAALARGVTLEFDLLGVPFLLEERLLDTRGMTDAVIALIKKGYADQILMSQDVCTKIQLTEFGGPGYDYVFTDVIPYLESEGVSAADIRRMTVANPARLLAISAE